MLETIDGFIAKDIVGKSKDDKQENAVNNCYGIVEQRD
jgi:hypothetical protein